MTSYSIPRNSRCLTSTPRIQYEELSSESGTISRKQSIVPDAQNAQEYDENSNVVLGINQNNNNILSPHERQFESSNDIDSLIFDSNGNKLNPDIEEVVDKIYDWIENEDKHKRYQEDDSDEKEDFFKWINESERTKIIDDVLSCFENGEKYEILTDIEIEQRYFAKNLDAIPLHLLLVHSTEDLLDSLENVKRVPSAGEALYTIEDESYDFEFIADMENIGSPVKKDTFRLPSISSELSLDDTQSSCTNLSYANSSFGYQTECDFDELINGVSEIELNCEESLLQHEYSYGDEEVMVEFPQSFFDKL
ncbi:Hypothetical protein SRAE_1000297400 [Strongyloides ratti]|uniref:Uncharacterized protein n=1 Tax=Strongyloides ratti TaxID=34506 RepID=A0A090L4M3_STRRB|nr:Hypothetical protein SRAE_1000297400 [Strongyloides ratti]CEF64721.1 Hypothetical protein SRAE_1000297400 [Strongyloides ratti]